MKQANILIVDDSYDVLDLLRRQLTELGYRVFQAPAVNEAIELLKSSATDLLITDLQMPGLHGMHLVKFASEHYPDIPVLVITGFPSIEGAVDAVKSGAVEYLVKPFTQGELEQAVKQTLSQRKAEQEIKSGDTGKPSDNFYGLIGRSAPMQEIYDLILRTGRNRATVLITGESGTGKELVARAIHYSGIFAHHPFVAVNCGGIPETLLESELFGYKKGAFTGASETRAGFFQAADSGTIFLDEIGNASLPVQQRLLRVLQEKEITMVGAQKPQKVDVRIIAATNSNLQKMVSSGTLREDLYYRLNVVNIELPPLKDRKEDIPLLVKHFIRKFSREFQKRETEISPKAIELLMRYNWPGNIRELENVVQRALIMSDREIDIQHLPDFLKMKMPEMQKDNLKSLEEMEKDYIKKVLASVNNNKTRAAEILGIDRKTLRGKISGN